MLAYCNKIDINKLKFYLLIAIFFVLPLNKVLTTWNLILYTLFSIPNIIALLKGKLSGYSNVKVLYFGILYFLYVIGLVNTKNFTYAFFDLEVKFSLIFLPFLFYITEKQQFNINLVHKYLISFIYGLVLNITVCLVVAFYNYFILNQTIYVFFYSLLSYFFHPSYLSMYLNFGIITLLYLYENKVNNRIFNPKIALIIIFIFTIFIFLLSSKAGIISLAIIYILLFIYLLFVKKRYLIGIIFIVSFMLFVSIILNLFPSVKSRIENALKVFTSKNNSTLVDGESNSDRIFIWKISTKILKENFLFGVGTGDVKDALLEKYREKGLVHAYDQKLNAHNQFLQSFISIGLFGFIALLFCLLIPLYFAIVNRNYLYGLFLILIILNISVESMFENQAGVVFYAFINSFLFVASKNLYKKKNIDANA